MPARASVLIIGGGVMGTSIAWHLAAAGVTDVVLLESRTLGCGSSGKPLGGVRAQFSAEPNVVLGARSLRAFERFEQEVGPSIDLHQVGYLFALRTDAEVAAFEASIAMQNRLGVPSRIVSPSQARELNPFLSLEGIVACAFSPEDGYAHPLSVVRGYAEAAHSLGAVIVTGTPATGIEVASGQATVVHTDAGPIQADAVVCAAGAWSGPVGAMAGVRLPVEPIRRQIALTPPLSPAPPQIPFTIDYSSTFYVHNAGDGLLLGMSDHDQAAGFDTGYDEYWLPALRTAATRCVPELADVPLTHGWAGLYEQTPDSNALIGRSSQVENFYYATGFSGHGFLQAPAVGELVRDLYLERELFLDISVFDVARFDAPAGPLELNIV